MEPKSDYKYRIDNHGKSVLVIEDQNLGNMSVTNDIENVLKKISEETGKDINAIPIIYKDSDGYWNRVKINDSNEMTFNPLAIARHVIEEREALILVRGMS